MKKIKDYMKKVKEVEESKEDKMVGLAKKGAIFCFILVAVIITVSSFLIIVPAGKVGVMFDKLNGGVQSLEFRGGGEGYGLKIPIIQNVILMDARTQTLEYRGDAAITPKDKNGINFRWDAVVRYRIDKSQAAEIYKTKGLEYATKIIGTGIRAKAREITGAYAQEDLPVHRLEIADDIREALQGRVNEEAKLVKELKEGFLIIEAVDLRNLEFNDEIEARIIEKQKRLQLAQEQEYNLLIVEKEREIQIVKADAVKQRRILEAEGEAQAILKVAQAKATGISKVNQAYQGMPPQYVNVKFAEAIKPTDKVYLGFDSLMGGNNLGVINYNQLLAQQQAGGVKVTE